MRPGRGRPSACPVVHGVPRNAVNYRMSEPLLSCCARLVSVLLASRILGGLGSGSFFLCGHCRAFLDPRRWYWSLTARASRRKSVWQPPLVERGFERSEQFGPGHRGVDLGRASAAGTARPFFTRFRLQYTPQVLVSRSAVPDCRSSESLDESTSSIGPLDRVRLQREYGLLQFEGAMNRRFVFCYT